MRYTTWLALLGLIGALTWAGCNGSIVQPDDDDAADDDAGDDDVGDDDAGDDDTADDDDADDDDDGGDDDTSECAWAGGYGGSSVIEGSDPMGGEAWSINCPAWADIDGQCQITGALECPSPTNQPLDIAGSASAQGDAQGQIIGSLQGNPNVNWSWTGTADGVGLYGEWTEQTPDGLMITGHFQLWIEEDEEPSDS